LDFIFTWTDMKIQLIDRNREMCKQWTTHFKECEDVEIYNTDFFNKPTDCVVSPANSFGFMDGSLDLAISRKLGWGVQTKLQQILKDHYNGELLVGQATLIRTNHPNVPYCISAPTMRVPMILGGNSINVYLATKAIFTLLKDYPSINSVTISGLGTGVGQVPFDICAKQMKYAYDAFWIKDGIEYPTWKHAQNAHQLLYKNSGLSDLQFQL
jgi:O-acetyl-ADP-ribose deacetylase (regulator of RNase III)